MLIVAGIQELPEGHIMGKPWVSIFPQATMRNHTLHLTRRELGTEVPTLTGEGHVVPEAEGQGCEMAPERKGDL